MSPTSGYFPTPTTVKCDNPRCNAQFEVPNLLGGHTFTCNRCGSRVTIRDLSTSTRPEGVRRRFALPKWRRRRPSNTPLLDSVVSAHDRSSATKAQMALAVLVLLIVIVILARWALSAR